MPTPVNLGGAPTSVCCALLTQRRPRRAAHAVPLRPPARRPQALPADFSFSPVTFSLPGELEPLKSWMTSQKRKPTVIVKPDAGCQGRGIFLTKSVDDVASVEGAVAQQYLPSPLLIDGYKFDLRVYVLVVSCSPLRVLLFKDGLARFCTERYR